MLEQLVPLARKKDAILSYLEICYLKSRENFGGYIWWEKDGLQFAFVSSNCLQIFQFVVDFLCCVSNFLPDCLSCWLTVTLGPPLDEKTANFHWLVTSLWSSNHPIISTEAPHYYISSNPYIKSQFHTIHICYAFLDLTLNIILPLQKPKIYVFGFGLKQQAFSFS